MKSFTFVVVFLLVAATLCDGKPRKAKKGKLTSREKEDLEIEAAFEEETNVRYVGDEEDLIQLGEHLRKIRKEIKEQNSKPGHTFTMKEYPEDAMSSKEFEKNREGLKVRDKEDRGLGLLLPPESERVTDEASEAYFNSLRMNRQSVPSSLDNRVSGIISPVKNQGSCGSCVAFSSAAIFETCMYKTGVLSQHVDLSEQDILNCGYDGTSAWGCNGAYLDSYAETVTTDMTKFGGLTAHEVNEPYESSNLHYTCSPPPDRFSSGARVKSFSKSWSMDDNTMKQLINEHGAVLTGVHVSDEFQNYNDGIMNHHCLLPNQTINHAVVLVGYASDSNGLYYIGKNSWGTNWGENGFFRIRAGTCHIATTAVVVDCEETGTQDETPTTAGPPYAPDCDVSNTWPNYAFQDATYIFGNGVYAACTTEKICTVTTPANPHNSCMLLCGNPTC